MEIGIGIGEWVITLGTCVQRERARVLIRTVD